MGPMVWSAGSRLLPPPLLPVTICPLFRSGRRTEVNLQLVALRPPQGLVDVGSPPHFNGVGWDGNSGWKVGIVDFAALKSRAEVIPHVIQAVVERIGIRECQSYIL